MDAGLLSVPRVNLAFAWGWILCGFVSGALMGLRFKDPNWMGGYSSFPRRLYRLAHISFFGLGLMNLLFAVTAVALGLGSTTLAVAAWAFIAGGILMPICCLAMAHWGKAKPALVFALPVSSLLVGGSLTFYLILKS